MTATNPRAQGARPKSPIGPSPAHDFKARSSFSEIALLQPWFLHFSPCSSTSALVPPLQPLFRTEKHTTRDTAGDPWHMIDGSSL